MRLQWKNAIKKQNELPNELYVDLYVTNEI